jgi:hypothetical protein
MKSGFILCCALFSFSAASAQNTAPEVLSSAGTSFSNGSGQLEWTLGETVTATLEPSGMIVSQGFHQPNLSVSTGITANTKDGIVVFPNPVVSALTINFSSAPAKNQVELYSAEGRLMHSVQASGSELILSMEQYPAGSYILYIKENNTIARSYNIIKSH